MAFTYIFAIYSWVQAAGYRSTYPTLADRMAFARSFAGNAAIRLFYGYPYHVITIGGYSAWRVGGTLALAAAAFGILAAVRALRAEEDAGRTEIVLAGVVGRGTAFGSSLAAIGLGVSMLWLAEFAGFVVARPTRGRLGLPGPGDGVGGGCLRRHRRRDQPVGLHPAHSPEPGRRRPRPLLVAPGTRRHGQRRRLGAMDDADRLGRGITAFCRGPASGVAPSRRRCVAPAVRRGADVGFP